MRVLEASHDLIPWLSDFVNFLASALILEDLYFQQRRKFMHKLRKYFWYNTYLLRIYADGVIRRCIPEVEMMSILEAYHSLSVSGHHSSIQIAHKILQCGFYWPSIYKDAYDFAKAFDQCQHQGNISRRQELPMTPILELELFDV